MTRSILAVLAAVGVVAMLSGTGCQSTGVGDPCTPEAEYSPAFLGFNLSEVNTESQSFQCQTRLCLVNHFQGRVSCPYGQNANSSPLAGTTACGKTLAGNPAGCCAPGTPYGVDGLDPTTKMPVDPKAGATVLPQFTDRTADKTVYCSCRCANVDGQTNDGRNYCTCPDGFVCTQLVSSIGSTDQGLTGAYCIKKGTQYDPGTSGTTECDPKLKNCGTAQGVH